MVPYYYYYYYYYYYWFNTWGVQHLFYLRTQQTYQVMGF